MLMYHIQLNNIDMCFVNETWTQHGNDPEHQIYKTFNMDTAGYKILTHSRENGTGGGIPAIYKSHLHVMNLSFKDNTSFEELTVKLAITTKSYIFSAIYRAPYSTRQPVTMLTFLEEFPDHITSLLRSSNNILITGHFNIPWNKPGNPDTVCMPEILDMYDLNQHIHTQVGNTIDWLIGNAASIIQDTTNKDYLSVHSLIEWKVQISRKPNEKNTKIKKRPNPNQWEKLWHLPKEKIYRQTI